jgi:uncharacterized protein
MNFADDLARHLKCSTPERRTMRRAAFALVILAAGCSPTKTPPCSSASGSTIAVHGASSLRLKPDGVSFSLGVETRAGSVAEAFNANARKVEAVIAALKQKGVTPDELQTSQLDLTSVTTDSGKLAGFRVSNVVTVRRRDIGSAPTVLEAAILAGANEVGGLSFFVADPTSSQRQGLELALKDARAKAEALASLSGRSVGQVICLSDDGAGDRNDAYEKLASLGYVAKPVLESGSRAIAFGVAATFELK